MSVPSFPEEVPVGCLQCPLRYQHLGVFGQSTVVNQPSIVCVYLHMYIYICIYVYVYMYIIHNIYIYTLMGVILYIYIWLYMASSMFIPFATELQDVITMAINYPPGWKYGCCISYGLLWLLGLATTPDAVCDPNNAAFKTRGDYTSSRGYMILWSFYIAMENHV